jgi:putative tryptophan/tyrosine transport system substrate-binding protein
VKRRDLIRLFGGGAVGLPLMARAQHGERIRRIGVLTGIAEDIDGNARDPAFREGLQQ